jgi:Mrp family chromosome partitioning ATPase
VQLVDVTKALRRYWFIGLLAFAVIVELGVFSAYAPPERYRSTATVLVTPNFSEAPVGAFQAVSVVLPSLATQIESRTFAQAAYAAADPSLKPVYERVGVPVAIGDVSTSVEYDDDTGLLTVTATSRRAAVAASAANALVEHAVANPPATTLVQLRVLDAAIPAAKPYTPVRAPILIGAVVLGVIGAVFAALATASIRGRARGAPELLERFGANVLGEIPTLSRRDAPGVGTVARTLTRSRPNAVEAFQTLRTNVELMLLSTHPEVITITSTRRREGKSMIAAHLSWALASVGQPVTLIDTDLRWPTLHTLLDAPMRPGVSEVGWLPSADIVRDVGPNMKFVPAGVPNRHPAEVVRDHLPSLLGELSRPGHLVVLDSPALAGVAESSFIVSSANSVILVIDAKSDVEDVEAALIRIHELGVGLLGVVINRSRRRHPHGNYDYEDPRRMKARGRRARQRAKHTRSNRRGPEPEPEPEPDSRAPDSREPDSRAPDSREPDSRELDSREPDSREPDSKTPRDSVNWPTGSRRS